MSVYAGSGDIRLLHPRLISVGLSPAAIPATRRLTCVGVIQRLSLADSVSHSRVPWVCPRGPPRYRPSLEPTKIQPEGPVHIMFSKSHIIRCDGGSRPNGGYCTNSISARFKGTVKREAKGLGWVAVRSLIDTTTHICPECQAAARGEAVTS